MEFDRELLCVASLLHDVGLTDRFMGPRFELRTHASSVREFRDHWAVVEAYDPEEMEEALVRRQDEMYARSHEVLERSPGPRSCMWGASDDDTADAGRLAGRPRARPSTP